jgi:hypothetical protein
MSPVPDNRARHPRLEHSDAVVEGVLVLAQVRLVLEGFDELADAFLHREARPEAEGELELGEIDPIVARIDGIVSGIESSRGTVALGRSSLFPPRQLRECLNSPTMTRFPQSAHRTGRADYPHPALGLVSRHGMRGRRHTTGIQANETQFIMQVLIASGNYPKSGTILRLVPDHRQSPIRNPPRVSPWGVSRQTPATTDSPRSEIPSAPGGSAGPRCYSSRNTRTGSSRDACRAGSNPASSPTAANTIAAAARITGSRGWRPKRSAATSWDAQ